MSIEVDREIEQPATFQELLAEFVALEQERREHEERLKIIAERVGQLQPALLDFFADLGMQSAKVSGLTVYVRGERYCSKRGGVPTEHVCELLRNLGLGYMVGDTYSAASLKSKVKEWEEAGVEVPPELAACLNYGQKFSLVTVKS